MTIYSQLHRVLDKPIEFYAKFSFSIFQFQDFVLIILAILVSCGLSRVYVHMGRSLDPGHAPVLCTKFTPARPAGVNLYIQ